MSYNMTEVFQSVNLYEITYGVNTASNGLFSIFILILIFLVSLNASGTRSQITKFMNASFYTSVVSSLMWFADLVPYYISFIPVVILATSIMIAWFES